MGLAARLIGVLLLLALAPFVSCVPSLVPVPLRAMVAPAYHAAPYPRPVNRPRCPVHRPYLDIYRKEE